MNLFVKKGDSNFLFGHGELWCFVKVCLAVQLFHSGAILFSYWSFLKWGKVFLKLESQFLKKKPIK